MKSPTAIKTLILTLLLTSFPFMEEARAQYVLTNPGEYVALVEGNELINGEIKDETEKQMKTALLQNTIAAEFTKIKEWEKKYSSYLQTAEGYASSLKAAATLYNDGVRIFITMGKMRSAIAHNPEGPIATISMNNLYIETATELVTVFTLLKDAVAKGGKENMLTGAERSQTLWLLSDKLHGLSKRFQQLYLSIRYYTMTDVWNRATAGMIDRSYGDLAGQSYERWRRAAKVLSY